MIRLLILIQSLIGDTAIDSADDMMQGTILFINSPDVSDIYINSLPTSGEFCRLLTNFANLLYLRSASKLFDTDVIP